MCDSLPNDLIKGHKIMNLKSFLIVLTGFSIMLLASRAYAIGGECYDYNGDSLGQVYDLRDHSDQGMSGEGMAPSGGGFDSSDSGDQTNGQGAAYVMCGCRNSSRAERNCTVSQYSHCDDCASNQCEGCCRALTNGAQARRNCCLTVCGFPC